MTFTKFCNQAPFLTLGLVGTSVNLVFYLLMVSWGKDYNLTANIMPWFVFLIMGVSQKLRK